MHYDNIAHVISKSRSTRSRSHLLTLSHSVSCYKSTKIFPDMYQISRVPRSSARNPYSLIQSSTSPPPNLHATHFKFRHRSTTPQAQTQPQSRQSFLIGTTLLNKAGNLHRKNQAPYHPVPPEHISSVPQSLSWVHTYPLSFPAKPKSLTLKWRSFSITYQYEAKNQFLLLATHALYAGDSYTLLAKITSIERY